MKIEKQTLIQWIKRIITYLLGLFTIACGVSVAVKSSLGVSPATSVPSVLSIKFPSLTLGTWTTIVYCGLVLVQLAILGKRFKWYYVFQFAVSYLFGLFVDAAGWLSQFCVPDVSHYALRWVYTLISMFLIALGVTLYLSANIMSMPVEGTAVAVSIRTNKPVSSCKMVVDMTLAAIAVACSLLFFHGLQGVREGTMVCSFGIGFMMKPINKVIKKPLHKFLYGKPKTQEIGEQV